MSESGRETGEIRDEDLPEDLQPGEDNPLAEPLDEDVDDLDVHGGKTPEQHDEDHTGDSDGESNGED